MKLELDQFPIHVRTVTGLEEVLADELRNLGAKEVQAEKRLVTCTGNLELLYKANLWCRTAIRVLRPLSSFPARNERALYEGVQKIDWSKWMRSQGTLAVDSSVHSSFSTHSLYIAQLVKDAVVDQFRDRSGERPSVDLLNPDLRIAITLFQDQVQIYLDASGDSLHKRGYRWKTGEAPLSETLAAGLIKLSEWDQKTPFLDPMCGSGTLVIEAGLMMKNMAPGLVRKHFGFQNWPDYQPSLYRRLVEEAQKAIRKETTAPIVGIDVDPNLNYIARENVDRAGLTGVVSIETGDFFTWYRMPKPAGTLITNPPYDERLSLANAKEFYQKIGDRLKQAYGGWKAHLLCGNLEIAKHIGLKTSKRTVLFNGSMECRLLKFDLYSSDKVSQPPKWRTKPVEINPKWKEKAEMFGNRLKKNIKNLRQLARREGTLPSKIYDWDIPELAFVVELKSEGLIFTEIPRNQEHSDLEHEQYLELMIKTASSVTNVPKEKITFKKENHHPRLK